MNLFGFKYPHNYWLPRTNICDPAIDVVIEHDARVLKTVQKSFQKLCRSNEISNVNNLVTSVNALSKDIGDLVKIINTNNVVYARGQIKPFDFAKNTDRCRKILLMVLQNLSELQEIATRLSPKNNREIRKITELEAKIEVISHSLSALTIFHDHRFGLKRPFKFE